MWRIAIVGLVACTEHGQTPPDVDAAGPTPSETARFEPIVCTSGAPDSPGAPNPNCLANHIPLDFGCEATFTVQPLGSGILFPDLAFLSGEAGVVIVNPKVVIGGVATGPVITIELGPGSRATLPSFTVVDAQLIGGMSFRFDSISTQP